MPISKAGLKHKMARRFSMKTKALKSLCCVLQLTYGSLRGRSGQRYAWQEWAALCVAGVGSAVPTCFANICKQSLRHNSTTQHLKNLFRQIVSCPQTRSSSEVDILLTVTGTMFIFMMMMMLIIIIIIINTEHGNSWQVQTLPTI
jgi:hypothetical protein